MRNFLSPEKMTKKVTKFLREKVQHKHQYQVKPGGCQYPVISPVQNHDQAFGLAKQNKKRHFFFKNTFSLKPHRGGNQILKSHYHEQVSGGQKSQNNCLAWISRYCLVAMAWAFTSFVIDSLPIHSAFKYSCCQPTQTWLPVISKREKTTSRSSSLSFSTNTSGFFL